jgi:hypothetical protein
VEYRTEEGTTLMNGEKSRKFFVKKLRELLRMNELFVPSSH